MIVIDGKADELIKILLNAASDMPGCKQYIVSKDSIDANSVWISEVWDSDDAHKASLQLPSVQKAMELGKPLISSFGARHIVNPIGGAGLN